MHWKPSTNYSKLLPFRMASAGSGRPNLLEKLVTSRPKVALAPLAASSSTGSGSAEGQDALLNGMTRSLQRRLSGLNLPATMRAAAVQRRAA